MKTLLTPLLNLNQLDVEAKEFEIVASKRTF